MSVVMWIKTFVLLVASLQSSFCDECGKDKGALTPMQQLRTDIFCNYDSKLRPVKDAKNTTTVRLSMTLKNVDLVSYSNEFMVDNWLNLIWTDQHLTWNPDHYSGVSSLAVHTSDIWMPDLAIYNSYSMSAATAALGDVKCILDFSGQINCVIPNRHIATCQSDMTKYPYDTQDCHLVFGSWLHTAEALDLKLLSTPIAVDTVDKNKWHLLDYNAIVNSSTYTCCPNQTFQMIDFRFVLERQAYAITPILVTPFFVLMVLSMVTLCLNPGSSERIFLIALNLLCHFIIQENLSWRLANSGKSIPLMVTFYRDSLIIVIFTLVTTPITRYFNQNTSKPPGWLLGTLSNEYVKKFAVFGRTTGVVTQKVDESEFNQEEQTDEPPTTEVQEETSNKTENWLILALFIDQLGLACVIFAYVIMFLTLIPHSI